LAVDNLNGAQVLGRTIRVDHVDKYRQQDSDDEDDKKKKKKKKKTGADGAEWSHDMAEGLEGLGKPASAQAAAPRDVDEAWEREFAQMNAHSADQAGEKEVLQILTLVGSYPLHSFSVFGRPRSRRKRRRKRRPPRRPRRRRRRRRGRRPKGPQSRSRWPRNQWNPCQSDSLVPPLKKTRGGVLRLESGAGHAPTVETAGETTGGGMTTGETTGGGTTGGTTGVGMTTGGTTGGETTDHQTTAAAMTATTEAPARRRRHRRTPPS